MRSTLLADRYAQALHGAIADPAQLEKAAEVLNTLSALCATEVQFRRAVANPVLDKAVRRQILDAALKPLGASAEITLLMHMLLDRNRMTILPALAARFESHINDWLNRVEVTVVTAVSLTRELRARMIQSLERFSGKQVQLKSRVDPNIIGGLVVYMWGVLFDFSLRTRLERLREKLLAEETLTYGH
jgi:F-type H+-transporting ATPase subunit delta